MPKRISNENSISEVLQFIIKENKLENGIDSIAVEQAWHKIMGAPISKYTSQITFKKQTLYVKLTSSVVRQELSYGKDKIKVLLNEELKKEIVKDIVLQ